MQNSLELVGAELLVNNLPHNFVAHDGRQWNGDCSPDVADVDGRKKKLRVT